jgi:uncharacterized protein (TIGR02145 family)
MKTMLKMTIMVLLAVFLLPACKTVDEVPDHANGVRFDEAATATVQIGEQTWMAENLKVTVDSAGNLLQAVAYDFDESLAERYGRLYTHAEALQACPPGWRLPTMQDWQVMFDRLGGIAAAGGKLKTVDYWQEPNVGATNSSGFSALPAGGAGAANQFDGLGFAAHFWSSTQAGNAAQAPSLMNSQESAYVLDLDRSMKASVRYIRN